MSVQLPHRGRVALVGALVFFFALATFVVAAPLDPEPYHDGSQLPAAIAVSEGMVVHRDVFSAYGFLTAWLQGLAVHVFGPYLIVIRLFTAVLLAVIALLTFILARWTTRSTWMGAGLGLLWVVAWPGRAVMWGTPLLPWPSVVYLAFQLGALLVFWRGMLTEHRRTWMLGGAGLLTGLAVLTRMNYGAAFTVALLVTMLSFGPSRGLRVRDWLATLGGGLLGVGLPLGVIAAQGAFPAFVDQSILGPLQGKAIVKPTEWFYYENAYLWGSALLLVSLIALLWMGKQHWLSDRAFRILVALDVLALAIWSSTAIDGSPLRDLILSKVTWAPALDGQAIQPMFLAAIMTLFFTVAVIVVAAWYVIRRNHIVGSHDQLFIVSLALTGAASLVQLFPVADPNHLWWSAPIPLVLLVYGLTVTAPQRARWAVSAVIVVPALVVSIATTAMYLNRPRTEITSGTLAGMRIDSNFMPSIKRVDVMLADVDPRSAEFRCAGGLFAVWNGTYLASGPGYVDYAYGLERASQPQPTTRLFICAPLDESDGAIAAGERPGLMPVGSGERVTLSYFINTDMFEFKASRTEDAR